jgi:hypothetical protein
MCLHYHFTCIHFAKHSKKQDTLHQPQGLISIYGVKELVAKSCTQFVMMGDTFHAKYNGMQSVHKFLLYKDFKIQFPQWTLPSEGLGENKMKEYIFTHYEEELVEKYSSDTRKVKICNNIPLEFNKHDIKELHYELENVIQLHES